MDRSKFKAKDEFIHFLDTCDYIAFNKAIDYINVRGFIEGMYDHLLFSSENILIEAMEYANSSYTLIKDYLEAKYDIKIY